MPQKSQYMATTDVAKILVTIIKANFIFPKQNVGIKNEKEKNIYRKRIPTICVKQIYSVNNSFYETGLVGKFKLTLSRARRTSARD